MYEYNDFKFYRNNRLYTRNGTYTGIRLEPNLNHTDLYYVCIFDTKVDYYNKDRAKDNAIKLAMSISNKYTGGSSLEARTEEFRVGELG